MLLAHDAQQYSHSHWQPEEPNAATPSSLHTHSSSRQFHPGRELDQLLGQSSTEKDVFQELLRALKEEHDRVVQENIYLRSNSSEGFILHTPRDDCHLDSINFCNDVPFQNHVPDLQDKACFSAYGKSENLATIKEKSYPKELGINSVASVAAFAAGGDDLSIVREGQPISSSMSEEAAEDHLQQWQQELIDLFKVLDTDGSGSLSTDELRMALLAAGLPRARVGKIIKLADCDRSGEIDLREWCHTITSKSRQSDMHRLGEGLVEKRMKMGVSNLSMTFEEERHSWMLHPMSPTRLLWDSLLAILCIYVGVALPFELAWGEALGREMLEILEIVDRVITYTFIFDIVLNFRTGYFDQDGQLVMTFKRCAKNYLNTWFLLDIAASFPFEDLTGRQAINSNFFKALKLGKLLKVLKILSTVHIDLSGVSDTLDDITNSKPVQIFYRRFGVLANTFFLCHWMACGMKMCSSSSDGYLGKSTFSTLPRWEYLTALYWGMTTLTTVGYGDIIPTTDYERLYTIAAMVIGGGFYGYVVGSITSVVSNNDLNASAFYDRMDLIAAWLQHHKLPMQLKRTIRRHFKYLLIEKSAINEAELWHDLSPELQRDVGQYILHDDVKHNPLFDGLSAGSVVRLQSILQCVTILPGHTVTRKGEAGTAMYIIVAGILEMCTNAGDDADASAPRSAKHSMESGTMKLHAGQSFGEEVLLGFVEDYEYTITAVQKSKLEMILEDEFLNLFSAMPNVFERMRQNALKLNPEWGLSSDDLRMTSVMRYSKKAQ